MRSSGKLQEPIQLLLSGIIILTVCVIFNQLLWLNSQPPMFVLCSLKLLLIYRFSHMQVDPLIRG